MFLCEWKIISLAEVTGGQAGTESPPNISLRGVICCLELWLACIVYFHPHSSVSVLPSPLWRFGKELSEPPSPLSGWPTSSSCLPGSSQSCHPGVDQPDPHIFNLCRRGPGFLLVPQQETNYKRLFGSCRVQVASP